MIKMVKNTLFLFLLHTCFLQGCSSLRNPSPPSETTKTSEMTQKNLTRLNNFEATGKVGFSDGKRGGHATVRWTQTGNDYQIRLYGPLGSGSLEIAGVAKSVYLIQSTGERVHAKTPEALVSRELGWTIPVSGLRYWLRGLPAPGTPPKQMVYDPTHTELQRLEQQGWTVEYQAYQDVNGLRLPYKLLLKNGSIHLKFIFKEWLFS